MEKIKNYAVSCLYFRLAIFYLALLELMVAGMMSTLSEAFDITVGEVAISSLIMLLV